MKLFKGSVTVLTIIFLSLPVFTACQSAEQNAEITSLNDFAQEAIDKKESFDKRLDIFSKLKDLDQHQSDIAAKLQLTLEDDIKKAIDEKDYAKAFDMSDRLYTVYAMFTTGTLLDQTSKLYATELLFKNKNLEAYTTANRALTTMWDEAAMDLKLQASFNLMEDYIKENNLPEAQKYYDDIMSVVDLKGNENLAKKYRENTKKYSDKFPDSKYK